MQYSIVLPIDLDVLAQRWRGISPPVSPQPVTQIDRGGVGRKQAFAECLGRVAAVFLMRAFAGAWCRLLTVRQGFAFNRLCRFR